VSRPEIRCGTPPRRGALPRTCTSSSWSVGAALRMRRWLHLGAIPALYYHAACTFTTETWPPGKRKVFSQRVPHRRRPAPRRSGPGEHKSRASSVRNSKTRKSSSKSKMQDARRISNFDFPISTSGRVPTRSDLFGVYLRSLIKSIMMCALLQACAGSDRRHTVSCPRVRSVGSRRLENLLLFPLALAVVHALHSAPLLSRRPPPVDSSAHGRASHQFIARRSYRYCSRQTQ